MKKIDMQTWAKWILCAPVLLAFGCASFELTSDPVADVYVGGKKVATTPYYFSLMSGERKVTLKHPGYVEKEFVVSAVSQKDLHFQLQWVGRTRIDTLPRGATVLRFQDREELGVSPCGLRLATPESVLIEKEGFEPARLELVPNESYVLELKPIGGFQSAYYKEIAFTSTQGAVEIFDRVAGEKVGTTPVQLHVEAGSELEYRLAGFKTQVALISKMAPRRIDIELEPITKTTLHGPAGAQVYRAGGTQPVGQVPFTVEIDHDVFFKIKMDGYYESTVALAPGAPADVDVGLKKIPYKTINTTPPGAEVYRLGGLEKLGDSPFTTVVDGECVFEIKKRGFQPSIIGMGPSSPAEFNVPLAPVLRDDPDAAALGTLDSQVISTY